MAHGRGRCRRRCVPSDRAADIARREELLVGLAAHLRAHFVEAVAGGRADLQQVVDVGARVDQSLEVALADEVLLRIGEMEARHERVLIALRLNSSHMSISYAVLCLKEQTPVHPAPPPPAARSLPLDKGLRSPL